MEDKRLEAAEQLLDRGVRFRLPAPVFLRWLRPSLTLRAHKAGTIASFSTVVIKNDLEAAVLLGDTEFLHKSVKPIAECLAISGLNGYLSIKFFTRIVKWYLLWQLEKDALVEMFLLAFELNNAKAFTIITKWYIQQMKTMLNPNLGQENGS